MGEAKTPAEPVREVRERLAKATPGPWGMDRARVICRADGQPVAMTASVADDDLIARAPTDLATLCVALEAAQAELQQLRAEREGDQVRKLIGKPQFYQLCNRQAEEWYAIARGLDTFWAASADEACAAALQALESGEGRDGD